VDLQPGQTTTVTLQLPAKDLSFVNLDGQWVLEPGEFRLFIADQQVVVKCE
jgi:beta-glucosidase